MPKRTREYRDSLLADLQDPEEAAAYLNAAFEDSEEMLLTALRDVAASRQMARVAEDAGVARETVYRMLSKSGNPTLHNLNGILNAVGVRLCFMPTTRVSPEPASEPGAPSAKAGSALMPVASRRGGRKKDPSS